MRLPWPPAPAQPELPAQSELSRRWLAPLGVGIAAAGLLLLCLTVTVWSGNSPGWAYDLRAYYDGAVRLLQTGTPYQLETLSGPFRPGPFGLYLYSPLPALMFEPLTALPIGAAAFVWIALRVLLLGLTCALMPIPRSLRLLVFGIAAFSGPVLYDLSLGNVSLVVTFLSVVLWRWLDRPLGSAALAVSLTVRTPMALLCGWWLLRRRWRPIAWTVFFGLLLVAATLPFMPIDRWFDFVTVLRNVSNVTGVEGNVDLGSAVLLVGGPSWAAPWALFAGYLISIAAMLWSLRRDRELSFVVTLMATLLLSPLLWDHYLTQLIVPAAFLAGRGRWWGLGLPLLGWLPPPALPIVAVVGLLVPFLAPDRGPRMTTLFDGVSGLLRPRRLQP